MPTTLSEARSPGLSPIAEPERIQTLDILRAVALFGVFLMNVQYFTQPLETIGRAIEPGLHGANYALAWFEYVFMHGKFWMLFAALFGMGFAVMLDRAERAGRPFLAPYLRRTGMLLVIGLAHAIFVWGGDILHSYAIAACMLLLILRGRWWWLLLPSAFFLGLQLAGNSSRLYFTAVVVFLLFAGASAFLRAGAQVAPRAQKRFSMAGILPYLLASVALAFGIAWLRSHGFTHVAGLVSFALLAAACVFLRGDGTSRLWRGGVAFYAIVPLAILAVTLLMQWSPEPSTAQSSAEAAARIAAREAVVDHATAVNAAGSYAENVALRVKYLLSNLAGAEIYLLLDAVGMFLLGVWFIRSGAMRTPAEHRPLFRRIATYGLVVGTALALCSAAITTSYDPSRSDQTVIASQLMQLASLPLSLGYMSVLVLWIHGGGDRLRLQWLAPAGRMALTNYLLQSVIGTLVFYGYGLAQWGRIDRVGQFGLVLGVFALQVLASRWWLARFHFGPVEWLWRAATYLRWPPLIRTRPAMQPLINTLS